MIDDDARPTQQVIGAVLLSQALGELDSSEQAALQKKLDQNPALGEELEEIREHLRLHQEIRKVAPRRGSFERLQARMKRDGAFQGAVPGVHCMLRRSFVVAFLFGILAIVLLAVFGRVAPVTARPEVIGEVVYHSPSTVIGQQREKVGDAKLELNKEFDTGGYDASLWIPTGLRNVSSGLEVARASRFRFTTSRQVELLEGTLRSLDISPGTVGDGPFIVNTPHGQVLIDKGVLAIAIAPDGSGTQVSVAQGSARVMGQISETPIVVGAGQCTSVERGKLPHPARQVLEIRIERHRGSQVEFTATLENTGYLPVKVARAFNRANVYVLHLSHTSEYEPGMLAENTTLPAFPVFPKLDSIETATSHRGDVWLEPGKFYRFTFDISAALNSVPRVQCWLRLEYRGDLYAPMGQAKVKIQSPNLDLDRRTP